MTNQAEPGYHNHVFLDSDDVRPVRMITAKTQFSKSRAEDIP
jgi:hypothetical protein